MNNYYRINRNPTIQSNKYLNTHQKNIPKTYIRTSSNQNHQKLTLKHQSNLFQKRKQDNNRFKKIIRLSQLVQITDKKDDLKLQQAKFPSFPKSQLIINLSFKDHHRKIYYKYDKNTKIKELTTHISNILAQKNIIIKTGNFIIDYCLTLDQQKVQTLKQFQLNLNIQLSLANVKHKNNSLKKFNIVKCIGSGGFSKVFLVQYNGKFMALKVIDKMFILKNQKQQMIYNQRNILMGLNHQLATKIYFAIQTERYLSLALEFCSGGQLFYLLSKIKRMTQQQARFYFLEVLAALNELHQKKIIYRDLKPQNIMINYDGHIKLADYGLSKIVKQDQLNYSFCGSAEYMAPQMLLKNGHSFNLDYYCLGALLFQLLVGLPPYYSKNQDQIFHNIFFYNLTFPQNNNFSEEVKSLMEGLLQKNPKKRLGSNQGIKQIMNHKWLRGFQLSQVKKKKLQPPFKPNLLNYNFDDRDLKQQQQKLRLDLQIQKLNGDLVLPLFRNFFYENPQLSNLKQYSQQRKKVQSLQSKKKKCMKLFQKSKTQNQDIIAKSYQKKSKILSLSRNKSKLQFFSYGSSLEKHKILSYSKSTTKFLSNNDVKFKPYLQNLKVNKNLNKNEQSLSTSINAKKLGLNKEETQSKLRKIFIKKQSLRKFLRK